ncbi:MAG: GNAT family N-acetyltransferase [Telluria sp.]
MPDLDCLVARKSTLLDLPDLMALLSVPSVAAGYLGATGTVKRARDTLTRNLAEANAGRGQVWAGCAAGHPETIIAYAALVDRDLAYLVHPSWQGRGLATAFARWACDQAFEACPDRSIGAHVFRDNVASVRVLERLGFQFRGLSWPTVLGCHQPRAMLRYELDAQSRKAGH